MPITAHARLNSMPRTAPRPRTLPIDESSVGPLLAASIGGRGPLSSFLRGRAVAQEGFRGKSVYLLVDGLVKSIKYDSLDHEVVLHLAEPGDLLGLEAIIGLPFSTTWKTVMRSKLRPLSAALVREVLAEDPDLALGISRVLMSRLSTVHEKLRDFAHKNAQCRACEVLLERSRPQPGSHGQRVVKHLTRQDLAAMSGMTAETFIRILSSFRRTGLVETRGRLIILLDPDKLHAMAGHGLDDFVLEPD